MTVEVPSLIGEVLYIQVPLPEETGLTTTSVAALAGEVIYTTPGATPPSSDASRRIVYRLYVDWDFDGTYTNETDNLIRASGNMRLQNPADSITVGRGIVSTCSLTLRNPSGRYSPLNTAGALYAAIQDGGAYHAPMYLEVSINNGGTYHRIFTGVLKVPAETGLAARTAPTAEFRAFGVEEKIMQVRQSTTLANFATYHDDGYSEEQLIAQWLTDAGLTDGTDYMSQTFAGTAGITATLDPGIWVIPWAWLDDESPLEDVWQLAAAAGGRVYADPGGTVRYENATHWLLNPHDASQETIGKSQFETLEVAYNDRELFQAVTAEVMARSILDSDVIWESDTVAVIPANNTGTITARFQQPVYALTTPVENTDYIAITSGGLDISGSVSLALTNYAQRSQIVITNSHPTQAAEMAVLQLRGQAVDGRPGGEETRTSTDAFWTSRTGRSRRIGGNPYIQSAAQAGFIAEFLRDRQETPRLFFTLNGVLGKPARRLGDRVTLSDTDVMTADRDAFITGIGWTLSEKGFRQMLDAIDADTLYPYQDSPGYFVLDTDVLDGLPVVFY